MSARPAAFTRHVLWRANLAALVAVSLFFRVWMLGNVPGVNGDEAFWGIKALRLLHGAHPGWRSNSGNLTDFFYLFPLLALHAVFAPSVVSLRAVAVISGTLLLPVNFLLCRKVYGSMTAALSTVLLAVLPVNILYSRFGWEPSQSVLAVCIVLFLALLIVRDRAHPIRWTLLGVLAFVAACDVHPTNVFAGPFLFFAVCLRARTRFRKSALWTLLAFGALALPLAAFLRLPASEAANRLLPGTLLAFPVCCLRLFSGALVYHYIAGSCTWASFTVWDALAGAVAVLALASVLKAPQDAADRLLLLGAGVSMPLFYVLAGDFAAVPGHERYALWMVAPGALLLARSAARAIESHSRGRSAMAMVMAAGAWGLLWSVDTQYFGFMERTGGQSEETFQTAAVEPKVAALRCMEARQPGPKDIVASEWWNYQPLRYFAFATPGVQVLTLEQWNRSLGGSDRQRAIHNGQVWFVEFSDGADVASLRRTLSATHIVFEQPQINDYAGRPILALVHPLPSSPESRHVP